MGRARHRRLGSGRGSESGMGSLRGGAEADGLQAWHGQGTVLLHDSYRVGDTAALLLERCQPGTPLSVLPEPEQDRVVADLLARLWQAPPAAGVFRPLQTMCQAWVAEFHHRRAVLPADAPAIDPGLARAATELFVALSAPAEDDVLLCTDLHDGNVLAAEREPWLVIDPKPFAGDRCYDVLQHMLNCEERLAGDPTGLTQRMAGLLGLDGDRVRHWLFARCVLEGVGEPALQGIAAAPAPDRPPPGSPTSARRDRRPSAARPARATAERAA